IYALQTSGPASVQEKLRFSLRFETDLRVKAVDKNQPEQAIVSTAGVDQGTFPPTFKWRNTCPSQPQYQLQLLRLYNQGNASDPQHIQANIDWSRALTIETGSPATEMQLHPAEGSGFYIWRVRPVGNWYPGEAANPQNLGLWGGAIQANAFEFGIEDVQAQGDAINVFWFEDQSADKNWVYSRSFNEGDHQRTGVADNITYANGLGMAQQQLHRLDSREEVLSRQELYDHVGRRSIIAMSAPLQANSFAYQEGILKGPDGDPYNSSHFDQGDRVAAPSAMSGPVADYFDQNTDPAVSSYQGYPFSRTVFQNDPMARPRENAGPSDALRLGSGHTSRSYFSKVDELELLRVFGDETPRADRLYKTTNVNEDGVVALSYFEDNRLIATCLQAGGASNMKPLTNDNFLTLGEIRN
ncbi:MAG: hypothetical protein AAF570_26260, partial [Bacteroidota bacterium]